MNSCDFSFRAISNAARFVVCQLCRSLALPLFFKRLGIAKMFSGVGAKLPLNLNNRWRKCSPKQIFLWYWSIGLEAT